MSMTGMPSVMQVMNGDFGLDRLDDRICGSRRRNVDHGRVGARPLPGFGDGGEDRQRGAVHARRPGLATLLGVHATNHLGAVVGERLFRVEGTGLAGQALDDDLGVFVDEN
jgi:hypothetical protein